MNELLQSIKADLLSRHMLPLIVAGAVALVAALAYVALAGGGSSKPPASAPVASLPGGLPVAVAPPNATAAASETPAGIQYQTQGSTRNPFTPLPGASGSSGGSSASSAGGSSTASAGRPSGTSAQSSGSSSSRIAASSPAPSSPSPAPSSPAPKTRTAYYYSVSALFGLAPANPGEQAALTPYEDMKRFEPLPSAKAALIVFVGVNDSKGLRAVFALIVPPILRGQGTCFPSDTHCQAIELAAGRSEELEYVKPGGETVALELKVVKISKRSSPVGAAQVRSLRVSRAGRRLLRHAGLPAVR